MGTELSSSTTLIPEWTDDVRLLALPWLDQQTLLLLREVLTALASYHSEVLAVILFGSVARHDERSLDDSEPSDVDLLLLVNPEKGQSRLSLERTVAIYQTVGGLQHQHRSTPREVQVTIAECDLADCGLAFIENVARDGILLWAKEPLPAPLRTVQITSR